MSYREKKYGINFSSTKEDISKRILGREAKAYTKRDIEKLKQIRGSELYRFGEVNIGGETVKGYATEEIAKDIIYSNRHRKRRDRTPHEPQRDTSRQPSREYEPEPVSSSDQIIANFLNPNYWVKLTERANNILKDYVANVLSMTTKDELALAIEASARTGDLIELRTNWYKLGMSTALSVYLEPYYGEGELLREFDEEVETDMEEQMALADYEEAMALFEQ